MENCVLWHSRQRKSIKDVAEIKAQMFQLLPKVQ
jgi:hypothetical protein